MSGIKYLTVTCADCDEYEQSINLRWDADQRAIKLWQAAHPGNDLVWPDHADMVVWLLDENDRLRAVLQVIANSLAPGSRDLNSMLRDMTTSRDIALASLKH